MRFMWLFVVILICTFLPNSGHSQQQNPKVDELSKFDEKFEAEQSEVSNGHGQTEARDPDIRDAYVAFRRAYWIHHKSLLEHRRQAFAWASFSEKVIFWLVILLVCSGIYFSGVQFHAALWRRPNTNGADGEAANGSALETHLEASTEGIKVSSPVLGVIILLISFLFFYMYLIYVWPIKVV